jgi:hypothetical protein
MMNQLTDIPGARSRIVIVGAGYAGYHCARHLERRLPRGTAEIVIVSPTDYMPHTSLLPQVGAGTVDPRHIAVSLSATLRRTRHIPGHAVGVDFTDRSITNCPAHVHAKTALTPGDLCDPSGRKYGPGPGLPRPGRGASGAPARGTQTNARERSELAFDTQKKR